MEEFLKAINEFLKEDRRDRGIKCNSFFVEHRAVTPNSTFKAIKDYNVTIYLVKQNKDPVVLFSHKITFNSSQKTLEGVYKEISHNIMVKFFKLLHNSTWEKITLGTFENNI